MATNELHSDFSRSCRVLVLFLVLFYEGHRDAQLQCAEEWLFLLKPLKPVIINQIWDLVRVLCISFYL